MSLDETAVTAILAEFSLRRVLWLFVVAGLLLVSAAAYERSSASVRLRRIERTAELANRLRQLDSSRIIQDPTLAKIQAKLKSDLLTVAQSSSLTPDLQGFAPANIGEALRRFFSGALIWFVICIGLASTQNKLTRQVQLKAKGRRLPPGEKEITGTAASLSWSMRMSGVIALLIGVVSIFLPLPNEWWFLIVAYPLASLVAGMGLMAILETIFIGLGVTPDFGSE